MFKYGKKIKGKSSDCSDGCGVDYATYKEIVAKAFGIEDLHEIYKTGYFRA